MDPSIRISRMSETGYLKIILGCMFSGKTSKLISIYKHNLIADIPTCIVNYIGDRRYDDELMSTHDGTKIKCERVDNLTELISGEKGMRILSEAKSFIINEGQFFKDLYMVVKMLVCDFKKIVYVGGLDGDYKMNKFGELIDLIPLCDEVEKLTAICGVCKNTAAFTRREIDDDRQILIGSKDKYIPVCRKCHYWKE